ncbi:TetR/AcrR family transcriptional regulator [Demequina litorisediminis]|uniref:TetR/AcrR family transcriptional regulator n=1 Tax=Demequina litorisediminis TaxID=1849022 RepID=UPI0024E1072E|nr:TetR/AcrR family transcriptional regulator [Demequina litorisediminis]
MAEAATRRRGDTRERIQEVALERFTANGYDQTSLREIAEDLGVTKAALYYHFKSKEEILDGLLASVAHDVDDLVAWMREEAPTHERRIEMIRRLGDITRGAGGGVLQCVQQNEVALANMGRTTEPCPPHEAAVVGRGAHARRHARGAPQHAHGRDGSADRLEAGLRPRRHGGRSRGRRPGRRGATRSLGGLAKGEHRIAQDDQALAQRCGPVRELTLA